MQLLGDIKKSRFLLTGLAIILVLDSAAQVTPALPKGADIAEPLQHSKWLVIKEGVTIDPLLFIVQYKSLLKLGANDELQLLNTETDAYGVTHDRYIRLHKSFPVAGHILLFHSRGKKLEAVNGIRDMDGTSPVNIRLSVEEGIGRAKIFFPASRYAWQDPEQEKEKKEMMHDRKATYYPRAPLVWQKKPGTTNFVLCYEVDLVTALLDAKRLFISAATGELIDSYRLGSSCTPASAPTTFYGSRSISTLQVSLPGTGTRYYLWNNCSPAFIRTRALAAGDTTDYYTVSNTWALYASATTSHWCIQQAAGYFLSVHGRQGWNNANGGCYVYQRTNWANASALSGHLKFGDNFTGGAADDWNSLDIAAHEYAHLVTESSADLIYAKESGALNESFSDIFGAACHQFNFGFTGNTWKVGYDRTNTNNSGQHLFIRDMANPGSFNDPDTYQGSNWVNTTTPQDPGDLWGVHRNSGVQNHMFYLLVIGGSGTNDYGLQYNVGGIGISDARRIAYQALTAYLSSDADHADARNAWVLAARTIFGPCSNQAIQTGKAWDAVGLPPPDRSFNYVGNYTGISFFAANGTANLATPSAMIIQPGAQVTVAARQVRMMPGFKALSNSYFRAYYGDCFYAAL